MDETILQHTVFRLLMRGMSRPGSIVPMPALPGDTPTVIQLLACILDNEVSFFVLDDSYLARQLIRHTGSQQCQPTEAEFIIICHGDSRDILEICHRGSPEYPDRGITIVYLVDELSNTSGHLSLSGPGIRGTQRLMIKGLPDTEIAKLTAVNREFPLGVDAVFLDRRQYLACIPRSVRIGVR